MKPGMIKYYAITLVISLVMIAFGVQAFCAQLTASGTWTRTFTASDLQAGAGSNLAGTFYSVSNETLLDVSNASGQSWQIEVRRQDVSWNSSMKIFVRRTGNGTPESGASVSGGQDYMEVTETGSVFFTGSGNISSIPVEYKSEGVSISIPPSNYQTGVAFTISEVG